MALIKCPECKKEISDKAAACVKCGCPVSISISNADGLDVNYSLLNEILDECGFNPVYDGYQLIRRAVGLYLSGTESSKFTRHLAKEFHKSESQVNQACRYAIKRSKLYDKLDHKLQCRNTVVMIANMYVERTQTL